MTFRHLWLLAFGLLPFFCHASAWGAAPGRGPVFNNSVPLEDYLRRLYECGKILQEGRGRLSPVEADRLIGCLPAGLIVLDEEGGATRIDVEGWHRRVEQAQGLEDGRMRLLRHVRALQEQLTPKGDASEVPLLPWNELQAKLQEIYQAREFQHLRPRQESPWLESLRELSYRFIRWLQGHLPTSLALGPPWIVWGIYGAILLAAFLTLIWILRGGKLSRVEKGTHWRSKKGSGAAGPTTPWNWVGRRDKARLLAQQGAHREAIRELFISVLMEGEEKGWWSYRPQATNGEHLARIELGSFRREVFFRLMKHYERVWYGLRSASEADYLACKRWAAKLEQAA